MISADANDKAIEEETLIYPQAILGFRVWELEGTRLRSITQSYQWPSGCIQAKCSRNDHQAPARDCSCGIYAYHDLITAEAHAGQVVNYKIDTRRPVVIGAIAGAGSVQVYSEGWRAASAQIIGLYLPRRISEQTAEALQDSYRVNVFRDPKSLLKEAARQCAPCPQVQRPAVRQKQGLKRIPEPLRSLVAGVGFMVALPLLALAALIPLLIAYHTDALGSIAISVTFTWLIAVIGMCIDSALFLAQGTRPQLWHQVSLRAYRRMFHKLEFVETTP